MAVPLGRYHSWGTNRNRLQFEKNRKIALGIASGIVGAGLSNASDALDRVRSQVTPPTGRRKIDVLATGQRGPLELQAEARRRQLALPPVEPEVRTGVIGRTIGRGLSSVFQPQSQEAEDQKLAVYKSLTSGGRDLPRAGLFGQAQRRVLDPESLITGRAYEAASFGPHEVAEALGAPESVRRATSLLSLREAGQRTGLVSERTPLQAAKRLPGDIPVAGRAIVGGKTEHEALSRRLEEVGIGSQIAGAAILESPIPILGFTKVDDLVKAGRAIRRGAMNSPRARKLVTGLRGLNESAARTLRDQEIVTLYHGSGVGGLEGGVLRPGTGLVTNREIAEAFALRRGGEVYEFRIPRSQVQVPRPNETWYVVSDQPQKPVTGIRRLATEVGGTRPPIGKGSRVTIAPSRSIVGEFAGQSGVVEDMTNEGVWVRFADGRVEGFDKTLVTAERPPMVTSPQAARLQEQIDDLEDRIEAAEEAGRDTSRLEGRRDLIQEQLEDLQSGLGPGTYPTEYRGIEETGIPGKVPEIEEAIPPTTFPGVTDVNLEAPLDKYMRRRGQYLSPALRRTLREAGYSKEEIEQLSRIPEVGGGAPGAGAFNIPGRETPTPATAPSPGRAPSPTTAPRFGAGQPPTRPPAPEVPGMFEEPTGGQGQLFNLQPVDPVTGTPTGSGQLFRLSQAAPPSGPGVEGIPPVFTEGGQPTAAHLGEPPPEPAGPIEGTPIGSGKQLQLEMADVPQGAPGEAVPTAIGAEQAALFEAEQLAKKVIPKGSLPGRAYDELTGLIGTTLTSVTSLDIGSRFRNAMILGWTHPRQWLSNWKPVLKATFSEAQARSTQKAWEANPWFSVTAEGTERQGLGFTDVGGHIYEWGPDVAPSERVPGFTGINKSAVSRTFKKFTPWTAASERNLAVDLNKQGVEVYAQRAQAMWDSGVRDPDQYKALAKTINHARFYGDVEIGRILPGINAFFSSRALVARFQVMLDPLLQPGSLFKPSARQLAAKNMVGLVAGDLALLGLIGSAGALAGTATVEVNPLSRGSDWLKAKVGYTRLDPWGGFLPMARLIAHMGAAAVTETGAKDTGYDAADVKRELGQFFANKEAPVVRLFTDAAGITQAFGGKKVLSTKTLVDLWAPFIANDVYEAVKIQGLVGLPLSAAGAVGIGVQTYKTNQLFEIPKYRTDLETTKLAFPGAGQPLALTSEDERKAEETLLNVREWIDAKEQQMGPKPDEVTVEMLITAYGSEKGLDPKQTAAAIFIHKARSHPEWLNEDWLRYAVENEGELKGRYPDLYKASYIDLYRQYMRQKELVK